jgi:hypothetical protein
LSGGRKQHWQRLRGVYRACLCDERGKVTPAGAQILANLRDMSHFERSPFSSDPLRMAHTVGMQDIVKHIIQIINLTDEQIARLDQSVQSENQLEVLGLSDDGHLFN